MATDEFGFPVDEENEGGAAVASPPPASGDGYRVEDVPGTNQYYIYRTNPISGLEEQDGPYFYPKTSTGGDGGSAARDRIITTTLNDRRVLLNLDTLEVVLDLGPANAGNAPDYITNKKGQVMGWNPETKKFDLLLGEKGTGSGGYGSNILKTGSTAVTKAQAQAQPGLGRKALGSQGSNLNKLFSGLGMTVYEPEGYGSPSEEGSLAYNIAKQGPAEAFRYSDRPGIEFDIDRPNAQLGPFGGRESGGISGEITMAGPQNFTLGGGGAYNAEGVYETEGAGFGANAPMVLQAYAPEGKSLITGDPVQDQANAAQLIALRDEKIAGGLSPAEAQQQIQMEIAAQGNTYPGTTGALYPGYAEGGTIMVNPRTLPLGSVMGRRPWPTITRPARPALPELPPRANDWSNWGQAIRSSFPGPGDPAAIRAWTQGLRASRPGGIGARPNWGQMLARLPVEYGRPDLNDPAATRAWAEGIQASRPAVGAAPRMGIGDTLYSREPLEERVLEPRIRPIKPIKAFQEGGTVTTAPTRDPTYSEFMNAYVANLAAEEAAPPARELTYGEYLDARDAYRRAWEPTLLASPVSIPADARARNAAIAAIDPQMRNAPPPTPAPTPAPGAGDTTAPPALPANSAQQLYDKHQSDVMAYRRRLAGLSDEVPVYSNTAMGNLPLGMRYQAPPTGYVYTNPGVSGSVMRAEDYALQQRQKALARANLDRYENETYNFAGGGSMVTPEEIIGIGARSGRPYFRVGEDANGDGQPDPELLSIRPLRNRRGLRQPNSRLPLGIMHSARIA